MQFFNEEASKQIKKKLEKMKNEVSFVLFTTEKDPKSNEVMVNFLTEIAAQNEKLRIETIVVEKDSEKPKTFGVYAVPCFAITGKETRKVIYYGVPMGHEFSTFLLDIVDVSTGNPDIDGSLKKRISGMDDMHLQVFVTDSCPHCPHAAKLAHDMAVINPKIQADVIDAGQFRPLAEVYRITSVPVDRKSVV